jgi:hypothetical protein
VNDVAETEEIMSVALLKKNTDGDDPRAGLRQAIAARAAAHARAEQREEAIRRAHTMVRDAEARLTVVGEALEATRSGHAEALAHAASTGAAPKANGAFELLVWRYLMPRMRPTRRELHLSN